MPEDKNKPAEVVAPVTETADVKSIRALVTVQENELDTLRPIKETFETVAELLGVEQGKVLESVRALREQNRNLVTENANLITTTIDLEIAEAVKPETARPFVRGEVVAKKPTNREEVKKYVAEAVAVPHIKALIESAVVTESGGNVTPANVSENKNTPVLIFE